MTAPKHTPGPTGLPRYIVRTDDGPWSHDSISAALDFAARRVYMGPVEKVQEATQALREGRIYSYAYGFKTVEIEPTGPEIPPSVVAAAPETLAAIQEALGWCEQDAQNEDGWPTQEMLDNRVEVLRDALAKATGSR